MKKLWALKIPSFRWFLQHFYKGFVYFCWGGWSTVALRIDWQNAFCSCFNWCVQWAGGGRGSCFLSEEDPEDL